MGGTAQGGGSTLDLDWKMLASDSSRPESQQAATLPQSCLDPHQLACKVGTVMLGGTGDVVLPSPPSIHRAGNQVLRGRDKSQITQESAKSQAGAQGS